MGTVSFENPLYFYKELKQVNTDAAQFLFTVAPAGEEPTQVRGGCPTQFFLCVICQMKQW